MGQPLVVLVLLIYSPVLILTKTLARPRTDVEFNVIIPEICHPDEVSSPVNISWIKEMVLLGIREDRPQLSLNIASPEGKSFLLRDNDLIIFTDSCLD